VVIIRSAFADHAFKKYAFIFNSMMRQILIWHRKIKARLPGNRLKADYFDMLQKLKALEMQVQSNAKQLELAKASFLKNLYHEIRTPLNAIMGFTNLLAKDYRVTPEEREEYQSVINKSSAEFLRIMDDIIQASLLEAGMIKINSDSCNLGVFFGELHSYFTIRKHTLEKQSIALLMNVPDKYKDIWCLCDKYRLNQVMNQLLENAFKFTEKGIVEFGYYIKNQNIEFYVKDTGASDLTGKERYIFSRFAKIDVSDNSKNGLGLGLSICKKLVELMEGKIWYNSNKEAGTSFYFSIPFLSIDAPSIVDKKKVNVIENIRKGQNSLAV
jgi:signal transduction histidine kinase